MNLTMRLGIYHSMKKSLLLIYQSMHVHVECGCQQGCHAVMHEISTFTSWWFSTWILQKGVLWGLLWTNDLSSQWGISLDKNKWYWPAPPIKRQPSRPKKKRNKEAGEQVRNESQLKWEFFCIKCIRWHKDGHNKATCKMPITSTQPTPTATATKPSPTAVTQPTPTIVATQPTPTAALSQLTPIIAASSHPSPPATSSQPTPTGGLTQ